MRQIAACVIWSVLLLGAVAFAVAKLTAAAVNRFGDWAFERRGA